MKLWISVWTNLNSSCDFIKLHSWRVLNINIRHYNCAVVLILIINTPSGFFKNSLNAYYFSACLFLCCCSFHECEFYWETSERILVGHGCLRRSCLSLLFHYALNLCPRRINGDCSDIAYSVVRDLSGCSKCKIIHTPPLWSFAICLLLWSRKEAVMWLFSFGLLPPLCAICLERNDQWATCFKSTVTWTTCRNLLDYAGVDLALQKWVVLHLVFYLCLMPLDHIPTLFAVQSYFIELCASVNRKRYFRVVSLSVILVILGLLFFDSSGGRLRIGFKPMGLRLLCAPSSIKPDIVVFERSLIKGFSFLDKRVVLNETVVIVISPK